MNAHNKHNVLMQGSNMHSKAQVITPLSNILNLKILASNSISNYEKVMKCPNVKKYSIWKHNDTQFNVL